MTDFVSGDTNSTLVVICKTPQGEPIDLEGYGVLLRWRYKNNGPMFARAIMVVDLETTGQVHRRWEPGELIAPTIVYDIQVVEIETLRVVTQLDEVTLQVRLRAEDPAGSASPSASPSPSRSPSSSPSASPSASPSTS